MSDHEITIIGGESLDDETRARLFAMLQRSPGIERPLEIHGDEDDAFVEALKDLKDVLGIPERATVVYPGSDTHVGVARVFGQPNVVHVEPNARAVDALRAAGYEAVAEEIEQHTPTDGLYDVLVALNSYGMPDDDVVERLVRPGGWLIANNYTHWATELAECENVELLGAVMPAYGPGGEYIAANGLPEDALTIDIVTHRMTREGRVLAVDEESKENDAITEFSNEMPHYPDALFVFRKSE